MLFQTIICDVPWRFSDGLSNMKRTTKRSAQSQYSTISVDEAKQLDVRSLADPAGCLLAFWCPSSLLVDGIDVMNAWGFTVKQTLIWVKLKREHQKESDWNNSTRVGMGRLFRQSHEIALIGTCGKSIYKSLSNKSQRSVIFAPNLGHSIKPPQLHERLEIMFPQSNHLEMFARRQRSGWVCIGDALDGKDIVTAIHDTKML